MNTKNTKYLKPLMSNEMQNIQTNVIIHYLVYSHENYKLS